MRYFVVFIVMAALAGVAQAHPIAKKTRDRTIVVQILPGDKVEEIRLHVKYTLLVDRDEFHIEDVAPILRDEDISFAGKLSGEINTECARLFAPILADRLVARINNDKE